MREIRTSGSVRGAGRKARPYRAATATATKLAAQLGQHSDDPSKHLCGLAVARLLKQA